MYRTVIAAIIALTFAGGTVPATAETYTTHFGKGIATLGYDANPKGKFPDPVNTGEFGILEGSYVVTTEGFPPAAEGPHDWYLDLNINATGTALENRALTSRNTRGGYTLKLIVDENGILLLIDGGIFGQASWADLGYVYVAGKGVYLTTMITPDVFFPPDPDRVVGMYESDYDGDDKNDFVLKIKGSGGVHQFQLDFNRSATWMGLQGTGLANAFADWLGQMLPGLPPDLLDKFRTIDMSPLVDLEALLEQLGGPIPGNELELAGTFGITLLVECTGASAVESSTWSNVKALYR